ncbi:carboxymuconolactone decarboxylase family protein [Methylobacterium sp. SyP6R]|uniref:carboxymuconolactone decarboxylase family protein n=1 Tax=Methylobacterium sp. SyP6R TaxID=2718876 RepID=UPI001F46D205|nr:carboxymuconolactone decarboxylase family protein [Methylobacterium sp. SyP6R]MCF4127256.1 carboxymuconolactone decarboxylase family protein [Methylobacterium sp. SyP6R]
MARIPYADTTRPETAPLADRIVAERGEILHLYAMLLHSPPVAEGWLAFLTAIRQRCELPGDIRELVIVQVAHLNGARYEAEQHVPIALREGVTRAQLDALPDWEPTAVFGERERAVLAYCDAMTRTIHVEPAVFSALRDHFDPRAIVELTATIGAYNMVSRFLEAIGIDSADDKGATR